MDNDSDLPYAGATADNSIKIPATGFSTAGFPLSDSRFFASYVQEITEKLAALRVTTTKGFAEFIHLNIAPELSPGTATVNTSHLWRDHMLDPEKYGSLSKIILFNLADFFEIKPVTAYARVLKVLPKTVQDKWLNAFEWEHDRNYGEEEDLSEASDPNIQSPKSVENPDNLLSAIQETIRGEVDRVRNEHQAELADLRERESAQFQEISNSISALSGIIREFTERNEMANTMDAISLPAIQAIMGKEVDRVRAEYQAELAALREREAERFQGLSNSILAISEAIREITQRDTTASPTAVNATSIIVEQTNSLFEQMTMAVNELPQKIETIVAKRHANAESAPPVEEVVLPPFPPILQTITDAVISGMQPVEQALIEQRSTLTGVFEQIREADIKRADLSAALERFFISEARPEASPDDTHATKTVHPITAANKATNVDLTRNVRTLERTEVQNAIQPISHNLATDLSVVPALPSTTKVRTPAEYSTRGEPLSSIPFLRQYLPHAIQGLASISVTYTGGLVDFVQDNTARSRGSIYTFSSYLNSGTMIEASEDKPISKSVAAIFAISLGYEPHTFYEKALSQLPDKIRRSWSRAFNEQLSEHRFLSPNALPPASKTLDHERGSGLELSPPVSLDEVTNRGRTVGHADAMPHSIVNEATDKTLASPSNSLVIETAVSDESIVTRTDVIDVAAQTAPSNTVAYALVDHGQGTANDVPVGTEAEFLHASAAITQPTAEEETHLGTEAATTVLNTIPQAKFPAKTVVQTEYSQGGAELEALEFFSDKISSLLRLQLAQIRVYSIEALREFLCDNNPHNYPEQSIDLQIAYMEGNVRQHVRDFNRRFLANMAVVTGCEPIEIYQGLLHEIETIYGESEKRSWESSFKGITEDLKKRGYTIFPDSTVVTIAEETGLNPQILANNLSAETTATVSEESDVVPAENVTNGVPSGVLTSEPSRPRNAAELAKERMAVGIRSVSADFFPSKIA